MNKITINSELNDDWMKYLPGYETERAVIENAAKSRKPKPLVLKFRHKKHKKNG